MMFTQKLKAGALQFVLFIGTVIAVLLLAFVLLNYTHLQFSKRTDKFQETIEIVQDALLESLENSNMGLVESGGITAQIDRRNWGFFEVYLSRSSFQKNLFTKIALVGAKLEKEFPALYLKDNQRPLVIVGDAKIEGDAFLPQQGIKPGNIAGQSYFSNQLVYGRQRQSGSQLPAINRALLDVVTQQLSFQNPEWQFQVLSGFKESKIWNSFEDPTQVLEGSTIDLSDKDLIGNVLVRASQEIIVDRSTQLTDVLLVAPKITFRSGFNGKVQAFANERITVGPNCTFNYPSVLGVLDQSKNPANQTFGTPPNIEIEAKSTVQGIVAYFNTKDEQYYSSQIKIEGGATIVGQVYCEKNLELKGTIWGSVATDAFVALENGNAYQNHLYRGRINSNQLPKEFAGIGVRGKSVAKWLY